MSKADLYDSKAITFEGNLEAFHPRHFEEGSRWTALRIGDNSMRGFQIDARGDTALTLFHSGGGCFVVNGFDCIGQQQGTWDVNQMGYLLSGPGYNRRPGTQILAIRPDAWVELRDRNTDAADVARAVKVA